MKTKQDLIDFLYNPNGRARSTRFKKELLISNGFEIQFRLAIDSCDQVGLTDLSDAEKLRAYCKNQVLFPRCKTCNTPYAHWSTKHNGWASFCSMACTQNDPDNKKKSTENRASVGWEDSIQKRQGTMTEKYGVAHWSQLDHVREQFGNMTRDAWSDPEQKATRLESRIQTNLEKYGVEHVSQHPEISLKMGHGISKSYSMKDASRKSEIKDSYRKSRLNEYAYSILNSKDDIFRMYITENLPVSNICDILGCHADAVLFSLSTFGIPYDPGRAQNSISMGEIELYEFVKSIVPSAIQTYKDIKHIDIYIPELKLGFEFNGVYWHSELKKHKKYHQEKVDFFYERGIRYIQIWEDDWNNNRDVVERFIKNLLGLNPRIGARKTNVVLLSQTEFDLFMNQNHMQGSTVCKIRLGLLYEGNVVSAMGFKNIPDNVKKISEGDGCDLARFANTNVTGAFTKLISFFQKNYFYDYITSFGDLEIINRDKNVYNQNGFKEVYRIPPDYRYYNYRIDKREHKFLYRKSKFQKLGLVIEGKTEVELAREYRLIRCYDSGKILYLKNLLK